MKPTVKLVPNEQGDSTEALLKREAERNRQDPESVVVVPFAELEGTMTRVDSNLRVAGEPVQMDVAGSATVVPAVEDYPSVLGETLADELDSFNPPHPTEIANQTTAYITGDWSAPGVTTIASEADISNLEKQATGVDIPSAYYHPNYREGNNG